MRVHRTAGVLGRVLVPQQVNQPVHRHHATQFQQQYG